MCGYNSIVFEVTCEDYLYVLRNESYRVVIRGFWLSDNSNINYNEYI